MIFHEFPDLQWLKQQTEQQFSNRQGWQGRVLPQQGWPNVILNVNTKFTYRDNIRGPLSIFTNLAGESHIETGKNRTTIREGFFYVSNHDQRYTLDINAKESTETFNIHFGEHFAGQVLVSNTRSAEDLLDNQDKEKESVEFHNRLCPRSQEMNGIISFLRMEKPVGLLLEEKLADLITFLLVEENKLKQAQLQLPVLKASTREEILKRLITACDFIYSHSHQDISLDNLAAASCLSKFHFLRLFKIVFGKTPHQFINEVRIQRSKEMLKHTTLDIRSISKAVGFDASSSFSRTFRLHTGVYPTQFRA